MSGKQRQGLELGRFRPPDHEPSTLALLRHRKLLGGQRPADTTDDSGVLLARDSKFLVFENVRHVFDVRE